MIFCLLKTEISRQLADLFNLFSTTDVFLYVRKTVNVVPVFKTDSKLNCSNCRPISLLSNIKIILEKRMTQRFNTFLNNNNVIFILQFQLRQQQNLMP